MVFDPKLRDSVLMSLDKLPAQLNNLANDIYSVKKEIIYAIHANEQIEADISRDVMYDSEKEELKKTLSNSEKRNFEIKARCNAHELYGKNKRLVEFNQDIVDKKTLEFDDLNRQFKAARAMAMLVTGDLLN